MGRVKQYMRTFFVARSCSLALYHRVPPCMDGLQGRKEEGGE